LCPFFQIATMKNCPVWHHSIGELFRPLEGNLSLL
jgi:hypothetical protein